MAHGCDFSQSCAILQSLRYARFLSSFPSPYHALSVALYLPVPFVLTIAFANLHYFRSVSFSRRVSSSPLFSRLRLPLRIIGSITAKTANTRLTRAAKNPNILFVSMPYPPCVLRRSADVRFPPRTVVPRGSANRPALVGSFRIRIPLRPSKHTLHRHHGLSHRRVVSPVLSTSESTPLFTSSRIAFAPTAASRGKPSNFVATSISSRFDSVKGSVNFRLSIFMPRNRVIPEKKRWIIHTFSG
jgi:hypothetical protein